METTFRSIGAVAIAAGLTLAPLGSSADTLDQPFLVTTTSQTARGIIAFRDVLFVRDGSEIAGDAATVERDRSCLAIVQRVLAAGAGRKPYSIGVALDDGHAIEVPMTGSVSEPAAGARLVEAGGNAAGDVVSATDRVTIGVHVDARVLAQDGHLEAATFSALTYLNTPAQAVQVSGCSMQRLPETMPAAPEPIAPA